MEDQAKATYDDVNLILRLYELRREEKLREARAWFTSQFFPRAIDDFKSLSAPDHPRNASFRMVISYWDMAASFAVRGPLDAALLLESAGELLLTWAKLEPFIAELREWAQLPEFLRNLEEVVRQVDWAPRRVEWLQARLAAQPAATDPASN
jgi:hypothetical protein